MSRRRMNLVMSSSIMSNGTLVEPKYVEDLSYGCSGLDAAGSSEPGTLSKD